MKQSSADFGEPGTFPLGCLSYARGYICLVIPHYPCSLRGNHGVLVVLLGSSTVRFSIRSQCPIYNAIYMVLDIFNVCLNRGEAAVTE